MTAQADDQKQGRTKWQKFGVPTIAGGVAGFFGAMGVMKLADGGSLGDFDGSRETALLMAMLYFITGLSVMIGAFSPAFGARFLNVEDADELREQRAMLTYSSASMVALATALGLAALAAPIGPIPANIVVGGFAILLAIAWFTGKQQAKHMDELMKAVSNETAAMSFYLLVVIGGTWSLLAHTEMVAGPKPLDWLTLFAGLMLVAAFWVCGKRGMLNRR